MIIAEENVEFAFETWKSSIETCNRTCSTNFEFN